MSGTLASRFQGRFGYGPGLAVGRYGPQTFGQTLPGPSGGQGQGQATPAPAQPAQTPVAAGAAPVPANPDPNGDGPEGTASNMGMGPSPGTLGGGLSGWGVGTYGTAGSVLGGLASLATGVPGLGLAAGALGTYADAREANGQLASLGFAQSLGLPEGLSAFANNATMGLAGQSIADQLSGIPGFTGTMGMMSMGRALDQENNTAATMAETPHTGVHANAVEAAIASGDWGQPAEDPHSAQHAASVEAAMGGWGDPGGGDFGDAGGYGGADASDSPGGDGDGWMSGGYTGAGADGTVQPDQPAGTVHEGEQVLNAQATAYYGMPLLTALNNMEIPRSRLMDLVRG